MKETDKIIVSACLAGIKCKYNGKDNYIQQIKEMVDNGSAIPVCPEELGGLPTPREPAEISPIDNGERSVINKVGEDVTEQFEEGAKRALEIAQSFGVRSAILKQRSPSCGYGEIYDGTFSKRIIEGNGITAELFIENGIRITTEEDIDD